LANDIILCKNKKIKSHNFKPNFRTDHGAEFSLENHVSSLIKTQQSQLDNDRLLWFDVTILDVEIKPVNVPSLGVPHIQLIENGSVCYSKQFSRVLT